MTVDGSTLDGGTESETEPVSAAPRPPLSAQPRPRFFLHSLRIQNFRAICNIELKFQPGLNVVIGENNAAKSAIIDALRLVLGLGSFEKREDYIKISSNDLSLLDALDDAGKPSEPPNSVILTATFLGRPDSDSLARYYDLLCHENPPEPYEDYSKFQLKYQIDFQFNSLKGRHEVQRSSVCGGSLLSNPVSNESLDWMRSIYLAPLRDLANDKTRIGAEIERLILSFVEPSKLDRLKEIPGELRGNAAKLIAEVTEGKHESAASSSFNKYARPYDFGSSPVRFEPTGISERLFSTMAPLFSHLGDDLASNLPLTSNGLGINQLVYASIVLSRRGQISEAVDASDRFFLIEEPEAHLHPQLQDSFFHAMNEVSEHQIFVTSHSPSITAKANIRRLIIMRRDGGTAAAFPLHLADAFVGREADARYLEKFLDVTRSQLLFARGAVFVEGVTEALLMQRFSEILGTSLRDAGVEIVSIGSAYGYDHFKPLFGDMKLKKFRGVFVTDGDEDPASLPSDDVLLDGTFAFEKGLSSADSPSATATGFGTFEFGLLLAAASGDNAIMKGILSRAFRRAAPKAVKDADRLDEFEADFLDFTSPRTVYYRMKENSKGQRLQDSDWHSAWHTAAYFKEAKSDYAFYLNEELQSAANGEGALGFIVPKYIRSAISYVLGVDDQRSDQGAAAQANSAADSTS